MVRNSYSEYYKIDSRHQTIVVIILKVTWTFFAELFSSTNQSRLYHASISAIGYMAHIWLIWLMIWVSYVWIIESVPLQHKVRFQIAQIADCPFLPTNSSIYRWSPYKYLSRVSRQFYEFVRKCTCDLAWTTFIWYETINSASYIWLTTLCDINYVMDLKLN